MFPVPFCRPGGAGSSTKGKNSPPRAQHATVPVTSDPKVPPPSDKSDETLQTTSPAPPPVCHQKKPEREANDTTPPSGVIPKHDEPHAPEPPRANAAAAPSEAIKNDGVVSDPSPSTTQGTFKEPTGDEEEVEKTEKVAEVEQIPDNVSR